MHILNYPIKIIIETSFLVYLERSREEVGYSFVTFTIDYNTVLKIYKYIAKNYSETITISDSWQAYSARGGRSLSFRISKVR